jgi:hypothetical protein
MSIPLARTCGIGSPAILIRVMPAKAGIQQVLTTL